MKIDMNMTRRRSVRDLPYTRRATGGPSADALRRRAGWRV